MTSIASTLQRIKEDLEPFLSEADIRTACQETGYAWRERTCGAVTTVPLFILQILCFNTAMTPLRLLAKKAVTASAYCRARMRLPLEVLQRLLRRSASAMSAAASSPGWCGLRPLLVDGSSTIAPDTPSSQKAFGQPGEQKPGCGFPIPKVVGLFDAATGLILELLAFPLRTHEQSKVWRLHPLLGPGDLLLGDRGLCSFAHLAMLAACGVAGWFRMHQRQIVDFRPHRKAHGSAKRQGRSKRTRQAKGQTQRWCGKQRIPSGQPSSQFVKRLGKHDQIVQWRKPSQRPKWMTIQQYESLPATLHVRELRSGLPRKGQRTLCVTIATTLLRALGYPKEQIIAL